MIAILIMLGEKITEFIYMNLSTVLKIVKYNNKIWKKK